MLLSLVFEVLLPTLLVNKDEVVRSNYLMLSHEAKRIFLILHYLTFLSKKLLARSLRAIPFLPCV